MIGRGDEALLLLDSWAGQMQRRILIIGETKRYYDFVAQEEILMPTNRRLRPGDKGRAPKTAVIAKPAAIRSEE